MGATPFMLTANAATSMVAMALTTKTTDERNDSSRNLACDIYK
jgi:hypothetical protein